MKERRSLLDPYVHKLPSKGLVVHVSLLITIKKDGEKRRVRETFPLEIHIWVLCYPQTTYSVYAFCFYF